MTFEKKLRMLCTSSLLLVALTVPGQSTGTLTGTVLLDNKQPLAGAVVRFDRIPRLGRDASGHMLITDVRFSGKAATGTNGTFRAQVPAGDYWLCASGTQPNHLRSCDWSAPQTRAQVTGSADDLPASLSVRTGSLLTLTINDPSGKVQQIDPTGVNGPQTNVRISANTGGYYYRIGLSARQGTQWIHTVAVPIGVSVSLFIDSQLDISDSSGITAPARQPILPFLANDASGVAVSLAVH